jgi:CspA family cold shock protein
MPAGTIKKLVQDKGFGFISSNDGTDVFFHHSIVADKQFDNLEIGQQVEFTLDSGGGNNKGKGPRAASVTPA